MTTLEQADERRWGFGDVGIGLAASLVLSTLIGGVILSIAGWQSGGDGPDTVPMWGLALLQIPLWAGYLGAVWYAGTKGGGIVRDFHAHLRPVDVPLGLVVGIATQLLVLPALYVPVFWLTSATEDDLSRPAEELSQRADGTLSWALFALLVGIIAPIVEELFYRGLLLRSAEKRGASPWAAVVISALIFAAMHLQPLQFPGLAAFGLIAGALVVLTGRLGPAIMAHIGFNLTTVVVLYLQR